MNIDFITAICAIPVCAALIVLIVKLLNDSDDLEP